MNRASPQPTTRSSSHHQLRQRTCFSAPRTRCTRRSSAPHPPRAATEKQGADTAATLAVLLADVAPTHRGLDTPPEAQRRILDAVERLAAAGAGSATATDAALSGTWRLLWTTEKETLWILRNAGLFGTRAGEVYQVVDLAADRLNNVITFPPYGAFLVDSSASAVGLQRVAFKFRAAKLKLPQRDISLPPFGQGWFDTVFLGSGGGKDGDVVRIARDSRGDTLIVARDGPPRASF